MPNAVKGVLSLVSGRLLSTLISILSTAVLSRLLTPHDFGISAAAMIVLALANVLFDGAFGVNLMKKKELGDKDVSTTLAAALTLSVGLCVLLGLSSPYIAYAFGQAELVPIVIFSSVLIPFRATTAISSSILQRQGHFWRLSLAALYGQVFGILICGVGLALMGFGVWALTISLVAGGAIEAFFSARGASMPARLSWDKNVLYDIKDGLWYSASGIMNWIANTASNAVTGSVFGTIDLGYYSRAWKLLDLFVAATASPISRVLLPRFAALRHDRDKVGVKFLEVLGVIVPLYAVAAALLFAQAPLIVNLALGDQWNATIPLVQILFAAILPRCAFKAIEAFLVACGNTRSTFYTQSLYAGLVVCGVLVGSNYGTHGIALSMSIAMSVFYTTSLSYAVRVGGLSVANVIKVHLKALILASATLVADVAVLGFVDTNFFVTHLFAGSVGILVFTLLSSIFPIFFWGPSNASHMKKLIMSLRSRIK